MSLRSLHIWRWRKKNRSWECLFQRQRLYIFKCSMRFSMNVKKHHSFIYSIIKYVQLHFFIIRQVRERHITSWFIVSFSFMYETCQLDYIRSLRSHLMKNHSSYNSSIDVIIDITSDVMSFNEFTFTINDVKKNHRDMRW
jgi:hypothetical protein